MIKKILVGALLLVLMSIPVDANAQTYTSKDEAYQVIKNNLLEHQAEFTMVVSKDIMDSIEADSDLMDSLAGLDDKNTSKDADYLKLSVKSWVINSRSTPISTTATLTFTAEYETTLTQEKKLDEKINTILTKLKLANATDYQKVKAIHNYIIKRVSYDQALKKNTAYDALIGKSSVCEGYTASAYRLFTDAGIECRVITGIIDGGSHSWNIVKVDGKWYNIDLTWDDPITNTGKPILRYDYFLKNTKGFSDHVRDAQYNTTEFLNTYSIAKDSYKLSKSN